MIINSKNTIKKTRDHGGSLDIVSTEFDGVYIVRHNTHFDERGSFRRSYCNNELACAGIDFSVSQGNISENARKHTLRGFHYQKPPFSEAKLISCLHGEIYNVLVDLRPDSKTYKKNFAYVLSAVNKLSLIVPPGCANAFITLKDSTLVHYYMSEHFNPTRYAGFRYDDPQFGIDWPATPAVISERDSKLKEFVE